jgi:SAM-dependent methyltransferase
MSVEYISWEEAVNRLRNDSEKQELVRNCYYDDPIEKAAARYAASEEWQEILRLLADKIPASVLDIGAGRGISSYAFAERGCTVTALEPDPSALVGAQAIRELFSRTGKSITIVEEKGENLPFQNNTFDIVYGRAVFHHAFNLKNFCAEAQRVLKPGGIFIMTREHVISRREDRQVFWDNHPLHSLYGGENAYLLADYVEAIRSSGLKNLKAIGPFESVINYFPMTSKDFRRLLGRRYSKPFGRSFAEWLAGWSVLNAWCGRRLSMLCDEPGRLYTFWATK